MGKPPSIKRAERIGIGGQRSQVLRRGLGYNRAALEQLLDGRLQEHDPGATFSQQISIRRLDKGSAAQRYHLRGRYLLKYHPQSVSFDLAKAQLAVELKHLANEQLLPRFDFLIEINECPAKKGRQRAANAGLASAHKTGERDNRWCRRLPAELGIGEHFGSNREVWRRRERVIQRGYLSRDSTIRRVPSIAGPCGVL